MTFSEFHRGLMLALAAVAESFVAEGPAFYRAYLAAALGFEDAIPIVRADPVFGTVREASEMLLEAMEDKIIELPLSSPQLVRFVVGPEQALRELRRMPSAPKFVVAAETFSRGIKEAVRW